MQAADFELQAFQRFGCEEQLLDVEGPLEVPSPPPVLFQLEGKVEPVEAKVLTL